MEISLVMNELARYQNLLSAGTAIGVAALGVIGTRRADRKRYTLDVLMRYSNNAELLKALNRLRTYAAAGYKDIKTDETVAEDLAVTMPHFSAIALAANSGLLDRDIILRARYASMHSIWKSYGPHLTARSSELGRPLLYFDVEEYLRLNVKSYARYERTQLRRAAGATHGVPGSSTAVGSGTA